MSEIKKYLDLESAQTLVAQIKAEDAKVLDSAKAHAEGLASNYEPAGSVATAKGELNTAIAGVQGEVDAVEGALAEEIERATKAEEANATSASNAKSAADQAQADVDALKTLVGTLPEGTTAKDVVDYVNVKTAGIATDAALGELQSQLSGVQGEVATIKGDYLKGADKEELQGNIDAVDEKADANASAIKAVSDDYLKGADKTELQGAIDGVQGSVDEVAGKVTTLVGEDANKSVRTIANEELAKQLIPESAKESLDTLAELAAWIQAHPDDASAMNQAIEALEALVGTLPEGVTATTIVGYIQELVNAEKARAEEVEGGLDERITAIENKFTGEDSVADQIADAVADGVADAVAQAAEDATTKANTAESNAKAYTDEKDTAMNTRVEALEAVDHEHANKALLDTYMQTEENLADAVAKKHAHENKAVLDGISAEKVAAWDASEKNAKDYADGLNTAMTTKVDGIDGRVTANAEAIALKASQADLTALTERVTTAETGIATNASAIAAFQPITSGEIDAMFA